MRRIGIKKQDSDLFWDMVVTAAFAEEIENIRLLRRRGGKLGKINVRTRYEIKVARER